MRKERKERRESERGNHGRIRETSRYKKKSRRIWTLNRSPHGNKTAREQFGREAWERVRERSNLDDSSVDKVVGSTRNREDVKLDYVLEKQCRQRLKNRVYKKRNDSIN